MKTTGSRVPLRGAVEFTDERGTASAEIFDTRCLIRRKTVTRGFLEASAHWMKRGLAPFLPVPLTRSASGPDLPRVCLMRIDKFAWAIARSPKRTPVAGVPPPNAQPAPALEPPPQTFNEDGGGSRPSQSNGPEKNRSRGQQG